MEKEARRKLHGQMDRTIINFLQRRRTSLSTAMPFALASPLPVLLARFPNV